MWSITGFVALVLLVITVQFSIKASNQVSAGNQNVNAYLSGTYPKVILLTEPNPRSFVSSIETRGTSVVVTEYERRSGDDWFKININEEEAGWVQGTYISLEKP